MPTSTNLNPSYLRGDAELMFDTLELFILACRASIKKVPRTPVSPCAGLHSAVLARANTVICHTPQGPPSAPR